MFFLRLPPPARVHLSDQGRFRQSRRLLFCPLRIQQRRFLSVAVSSVAVGFVAALAVIVPMVIVAMMTMRMTV